MEVEERAAAQKLASFLAGDYRLTALQQEVAGLVFEGRTVDEMAVAMDRSSATIKSHLERLYRRTRVRSRMEMILRAIVVSNRVRSYGGRTDSTRSNPIDDDAVATNIPTRSPTTGVGRNAKGEV